MEMLHDVRFELKLLHNVRFELNASTRQHGNYDIDIPIAVENNFLVLKHHSYICGYHAYMNIWTPIIGDYNLLCKQERDN